MPLHLNFSVGSRNHLDIFCLTKVSETPESLLPVNTVKVVRVRIQMFQIKNVMNEILSHNKIRARRKVNCLTFDEQGHGSFLVKADVQ